MQREASIPDRREIDQAYRWDLSPLFGDDGEWTAFFKQIEERMTGYAGFRGRLNESVGTFKEALDFDLEMSRSLERLYTYAHLRSDEDKTNQGYLDMYGRAANLHTRIAELSSFMTPEIHALPAERIQEYMEDPLLRDYRFFLEKIIRYRPHTLTQEIEEILAMGGELAGAPSQFFGQLDNADMRFGMIMDESGGEVELSHGNFTSFLMHRNREIRSKAFAQYYAAYEAHKHSISAALSASIKKDRFYSRVRRFPDCRSASLFSDRVEPAVYDTLVDTVRKNLSPLFRYLDFRKKALGLDELHFYDTYAPIVSDIEFSMPYEEAVEVCVQALAPLGADYTGQLREGLLGGWVDRYENRGKRSGAYSSGCYDSPPYILMNYRDDTINSLYTLIHEAGHSMHSFYAVKSRPYMYHDYTIFVAEVASTFNEALLSEHLLSRYKDDVRMRAYILNREIDNIRGTLFRQTMFAEFEKLTHELAEKNDPLTLETLTGVYRDLLKTYFGDSMVIDDVLALECLRIPHFYSGFYVYKYATGISASLALASRLLSEGSEAQRRYRKFLTLGGSMFPLEELQVAGVDMSRPEPVEEAIRHFSGLVDGLIALWEAEPGLSSK